MQDQVEIAAIWERLKERGFDGSYSSVYRFVRRLSPPLVDATVRVERPAGEEAQVDFGYAGRVMDPPVWEPRAAGTCRAATAAAEPELEPPGV